MQPTFQASTGWGPVNRSLVEEGGTHMLWHKWPVVLGAGFNMDPAEVSEQLANGDP